MTPRVTRIGKSVSHPFLKGFIAVLPFWLAAGPIAATFVAAAKDAGINAAEIQFMSLFVYSAPTQLALLQMWSDKATPLIMMSIVLVMNIHLVVYGLSLSKKVKLNFLQRLVSAFSLTDAVYGLTVTTTPSRGFQFLLGAEISMFVAWNGFVLTAQIFLPASNAISTLPLNFVTSLIFFALLITLLTTRINVMVSIFAAVVSALLVVMGVGYGVVILVSLIGPLFGVWLRQWD